MKYRDDPKRPLTLRELEAIVENIDLDDEITISYIPPEVDNLTDEENIDDDVIGETDNLPSDLAGTFEILHSGYEVEMRDNVHHEVTQAS